MMHQVTNFELWQCCRKSAISEWQHWSLLLRLKAHWL